jgi:hypothetical protein
MTREARHSPAETCVALKVLFAGPESAETEVRQASGRAPLQKDVKGGWISRTSSAVGNGQAPSVAAFMKGYCIGSDHECHASEQPHAVLNRIEPNHRLTFFTGVLSRAGAPQATAQSAAVTMTMAMV